MDKLTNELRRQYWTNIIKECNTSGKKKKDWLKEHNISDKTFYYWQRIIRNQVVSDKENPLVLLEEPNETPLKSSPSVSISKKDIHIEINEDISDALLLKIMRALNNA